VLLLLLLLLQPYDGSIRDELPIFATLTENVCRKVPPASVCISEQYKGSHRYHLSWVNTFIF